MGEAIARICWLIINALVRELASKASFVKPTSTSA